ncbi:hypothetical protein DSM21852_39940 [Methylocystis bryophila]|uniref:Helix-turn-helix domain-containing protein n=1 Tax=Methylocystis bryophila TaxID=655015 RepID=A0A1W6MSV6_9HYPH|nr:hypothetical protein B1812_05855 [Methylocystis bryophila]BDV40741.1 hypothetical protein DSM21852_39940 [Methylocystis bryophila]
MDNRADSLTPNTPLSLKEAAEICLRGIVKASTLRAAAERGELAIERLGRRIVVTPAAIEAWRERCRVRAKSPGIAGADGGDTYRTAEVALASARAQIEKLKKAAKR